MYPAVPTNEVWIIVPVGARWRFTVLVVRTISELEGPVLAAMMETVGWKAFTVSISVSSLLPRLMLSVEDKFFAKAMQWSRRRW